LKKEIKTYQNTSLSLFGPIQERILVICPTMTDLEKTAAQEWA
jgi:hypothetical protein